METASPPRRLLVERRRPGRPRGTERSATVSAWMRTSEYDRLIHCARVHRLSVSQLVRRLVVISLREFPS